jgi:protein TonB
MHTVRGVLANRTLMTALAASAGVHAVALAIRFVDPEMLRIRSTDPALEIVLVNARSELRPSRPDAFAQANLDGGGANESGRRTSPLPNLFEMRDGDALETSRRAAQPEEQEPHRKLALAGTGDLQMPTPSKEVQAPEPDAGTADELHARLARLEAEIAKQVSDYQKRPRRHHFMPSTSELRYARYVEDWRARVEKIGNEHYPEEARGRLYGALRMTVVIRKDGTLVDAIVEQGSGKPVLDRAARRIVHLAAPFPPFPPDIARDTDILEVTRTWTFTNDQFATHSGAARERESPGGEGSAKVTP